MVSSQLAEEVSQNGLSEDEQLNACQNPFSTKGGKHNVLSCFLCVLLFLLSFSGPVYGTKEVNIHSGHDQALPLPLLGMDFQEESYAILVEKQTQMLFLYRSLDGKVELMKSFPCSTGENNGDKKEMGDRKTPEGIYFFTRTFEDEELNPQYGVKAFVLNYPNFFDRLQKKDGRGIWLHGTNKPLVPNDSKGCIALTNQDLLELATYISLYRTPIIVSEKIENLPGEEIKRKERQLKNFVYQWLNSWEKKELLDYMSCYAKDFRSKGMNWWQWKQYKDKLNKRNKTIDVTISGVQGFKHDRYYLVVFRQDYRSDVLKSSGVKSLYLQEGDEGLKIMGEVWNPLRGGYVSAGGKRLVGVDSSKQQDDLKREAENVQSFIEQWRRYWENKELEAYIGCYSEDFKSRGMDRKEWRYLKQGLNETYKNIKVNITDAEISLKDGGKKAEVSFLQDYQADHYSDKGSKRMLLTREEGKWKIVAEDWRPL